MYGQLHLTIGGRGGEREGVLFVLEYSPGYYIVEMPDDFGMCFAVVLKCRLILMQ